MSEGYAGKRLLIVEESLKDFVGHWYEYVKAVVALAEAEGTRVTVVGHSRASPEIRHEFDFRPLMSRSPWDSDYRERFGPWRKTALVRHTWLTVRQVRRVLKAEGPFDLTFVPTVFTFQIWAWRVLYCLHRKRIGRLVLLVRNSAVEYRSGSSKPHFGLAARVLGWGIRGFAADAAAGRVVLATDSRRLAEEYRQLVQMDFAVFPSPRIAQPLPARARRKSGQPLVFACLGPARFEKGIDLLQQAIARYLDHAHDPAIRFVIQWPSPITDASGFPYLPDDALAASGRVDFLTAPLNSHSYEELLANVDCMVLPYRRSSYWARISGVAVEAVTAGIPVITTENTWTSEFVAEAGAGIAVADGDPAAFAEAISGMASAYPRFRREAASKCRRAARGHSAKVFQALLWGTPPAL